MLTGIIIAIHIVVSVALVMFILLKSGRGGGLSDMFGGGSMSSMTGSTVVERNLDRLTIITGVVFALTTIILALRLT